MAIGDTPPWQPDDAKPGRIVPLWTDAAATAWLLSADPCTGCYTCASGVDAFGVFRSLHQDLSKLVISLAAGAYWRGAAHEADTLSITQENFRISVEGAIGAYGADYLRCFCTLQDGSYDEQGDTLRLHLGLDVGYRTPIETASRDLLLLGVSLWEGWVSETVQRGFAPRDSLTLTVSCFDGAHQAVIQSASVPLDVLGLSLQLDQSEHVFRVPYAPSVGDTASLTIALLEGAYNAVILTAPALSDRLSLSCSLDDSVYG